MTRPIRIPRRILAIVREQMRQLARTRPEHAKQLHQIGQRVQRELERQLRALAPGRYTTARTQALVTQVQAMVDLLGADLGVQVGAAVRRIWRVAARVGRQGLRDQVDVWRVDGLAAPIRTDIAGDVLDPGLLELHEVSVRTYGMQAIADMRAELARGAIGGETLSQTWERLARKVEIPEWRAERIARTEQSYALHRRQLLDLGEMFGEDADSEWQKTLVTTFDRRTGPDSVSVDGQVRDLGELFEDSEGRRYMHPPNRPNDREVMVMIPRAASS